MTTKQSKPKAPAKPKAAKTKGKAIPKAIQFEIDEFKRTLRELEVHSVEQHATGWQLTVSAPKYGDAWMLEEVLSTGSARFKRMESVDQYTLAIHL